VILLYVAVTLIFTGAYVALLIYIKHHWDKILEIIVIDDHSEDDTVVEILKRADTRIHLIEFKKDSSINAHKKVALSKGLAVATGEYIIQLDADVIVPPKYIMTVLASITNSQADMIAAPVIFSNNSSAFQSFQTLDMMGMMALTGAGINTQNWYLANGANMIYKKGLVHHGESKNASGDDVHAIQSAAQSDAKIIFLKDIDASVSTQAEPTFSDFYKQRIRWATKNKYYKNWKLQTVMAIPYLNVLLLVAHLILVFKFGALALVLGLFHLLCKVGIDYIYLSELAEFFEGGDRVKPSEAGSMAHFGAASIAHVLYLLVIGTLSFGVKRYEWKGRKVS